MTMTKIYQPRYREQMEIWSKYPTEGSDTEAQCFCLICPLCLPELWNDGLHSRKNKKKDPFCPVKKKKPVVVSDILFPLSCPCLTPPIIHLQHLSDRCFLPAHCLFVPNCSITALYCLHAAGPWHPGRLDRHQKGILETDRVVTLWITFWFDLLVLSLCSPHSPAGDGITGATQGEGGW